MNIMNILAIETTGPKASVAIINDEGTIEEEVSIQKLNHLQNLMPMIDVLLKKCRLTINDMSYIAVSEGPGSFTGIRIGVASARALAQALAIDTISVPTLKSFAFNVPDYKGIICPIFDARRSQVYGAAYKWMDSDAIQELVAGNAYDLKELLEKLEEIKIPEAKNEIMFFGDGIKAYKGQILSWQDLSLNDNMQVLFAKEPIMQQKASSVARLAYQIYLAGEMKNFIDLKPVYLRKAEAERKLEENS